MAGQSISDRLIAAQHSLLGSDMAKGICKATTSELIPPKKKHIDYLVELTRHSHVDLPDLINGIVERSKSPKWVVVFKALITTHHLMCQGSEKVMQHVASRNGLFRLENFMDKSEGPALDMSTCIRRYGFYLNEKALSYRTVAYDFTRIPRGPTGLLRSLEIDNLLKAMPVLQQHIDSLVDFNAKSRYFENPIIRAAFKLMFKDLIRLFACYNDGIINLLEKYFHLKKSQCKEALDVYKKFLVRMNKISDMFKIAERIGIDRSDIPDFSIASNNLLDSLEQHFESLKEDSKIVTSKHSHPPLSTFNALSTNLIKADEKISHRKSTITETYGSQSLQGKKDSVPSTSDFLDIFGDSSVSTPFSSAPFGSQTSGNQSALPALGGGPHSHQLLQSGASLTISAVSDPFVGTAAAYPAASSKLSTAPNILDENLFQTTGPDLFSANNQTTGPGLFSASNVKTANENVFGFDQPSSQVWSESGMFSGFPTNSDMHNQDQLLSVNEPLHSIKEVLDHDAVNTGSSFIGNQNLDFLASNLANLSVMGQKSNQNFEPKSDKRLTGGANYNPLTMSTPTTLNRNPMLSTGINMMHQNTTAFGANMSNPLFQQQASAPYGSNVSNLMPQPLAQTQHSPDIFGSTMINPMVQTSLPQSTGIFGSSYSNQMTQQPQLQHPMSGLPTQPSDTAARSLSPNNPFGSLL